VFDVACTTIWIERHIIAERDHLKRKFVYEDEVYFNNRVD
jgi:hypothetical protein